VHPGFFGTLALVGPSHGEHGVDQGTVNGGQVSPGGVFPGQGLGGLSQKSLIKIELSCCAKVMCKSRFSLAVKGGAGSIIPVMGRRSAVKDGSGRLFFRGSKM